MYNIAKVAKGEILVYFNLVFDALCKVGLVPLCRLTDQISWPRIPNYRSKTAASSWIV
jgi:hypothetical protein